MVLPQITATGRSVGTGRRDVSPDAERPSNTGTLI